MFIAIFNGFSHLYYSNEYDRYYSDTFSPDTAFYKCFTLEVRGKTYKQRKNYLNDLSLDIEDALIYPGLDLSDRVTIRDWLYNAARRYGMVRELKEVGLL